MNWRNLRRFTDGVINTGADGIAVGLAPRDSMRYGKNIRNRTGAIRQRPGILDLVNFDGTKGIEGNIINGIYEYGRDFIDGDGNVSIWNVLVFAVGTQLWYWNRATSQGQNIGIGLSSTDIYCATAFDRMFIANGKDEIMTTDGHLSHWFQAGIDAPAAAPGISTGAGAINGYKSYKYTYARYDAGGTTSPYLKESNASDAIEVNLVGGRRNTLTLVAPTDSQVTACYIYATETYAVAGDPGDYYLLATLGIVAPITYTDNAETDPAAGNFDTTVRDVPPKFKYILWDGTWMFGIGEEENPSIIYYCQTGKPFYWDLSTNWDEISRDDGDILTGIAAIGQTRYIFKRNSIWQWTGDPISVTPITPVERPDSSMNQTRLSIGCADPRSLATWLNTLIFRASDGHVYMLTDDAIIRLSRYIPVDIKTLSAGSRAAIHNDYYIITDGSTTLVCDLLKEQMGWQGFDSGLSPACFVVDHYGDLIGTEGEKLVRYYVGTQDNGEDFTKIFAPAFSEIGLNEREGIMRRVIAECLSRDCDFTIDIFDESEASIYTGTYALADRHFSIERGHRANFMSASFVWYGTAIINSISMGFLPGRRH